jgi:hypothetical protein
MHHLITTQFSSATLSRVWKPPGYEPHSLTLLRLQQRRRRRRRRSCSGRTSTLSKRKTADRGNDDCAVRPLPVFNGTTNGPSKKGHDGDSYAVWRARLVINLRAKRLLSIVTGNDDDDDSDEDEIQRSVLRRQARAAHIMTSTLGTGPFLFVQGVNNDPAAIPGILDTKYQGTDTSSVMSAVNEFTTKKYRPGQHMEMFVAGFEGLAMRLEAIGHGVSEQMRVLNSLSEVSALSAALSALRVIDNLSWIKAKTQIRSPRICRCSGTLALATSVLRLLLVPRTPALPQE